MKKLMIVAGVAMLTMAAAPANATWGGSSGKWGSTGGKGSSGYSTGSTGSSGSTPVSEPGQMGLFAAGALLLAARRFRRKG